MLARVKICRMTVCDCPPKCVITVIRTISRLQKNSPSRERAQTLQYITMDKLYITNKSNHSFVGKTTETEGES